LYFQAVTQDQYTPGTEPSPVGQAGLYHFGVNICVEDIHPDLACECALNGANTLLNFTNDGWFYGTYGPRSHFQAAAWRAIEVRRPMLRVTNTGITAAIDPLGNISTVVPPWTEGVGKARLLGIGADESEFAMPTTLVMRLGASGLVVLFISFLLGCLLLARRSAK
jgi:apolipoprotein N-acyltransferase